MLPPDARFRDIVAEWIRSATAAEKPEVTLGAIRTLSRSPATFLACSSRTRCPRATRVAQTFPVDLLRDRR